MCISDNLPDTLLLFEQICITIFVCSHGGDACETTRQRPAALVACGLYHSVSVCAGAPVLPYPIQTLPVRARLCSSGVHAEVTSKAIAAGKPVFCEKPLATTKADCAEIVRNEQAAGRNLVQVGFMRRYDPDYCKIKAILDFGELGKPLMAHCISRTPRIAAGFTNAMQVTNVLIQEIDQFRCLFDEELVRGHAGGAQHEVCS